MADERKLRKSSIKEINDPRSRLQESISQIYMRKDFANIHKRQYELDYRSLFDHSPDAVFLAMSDGTVLAANEAACRMFRMSEEEICRAGRNGLIDPKDPNILYALEKRARTGKYRGELGFLRKDGTRFIAEITSVILKEGKSFVILRDTMECKFAEEQHRKMEKVLGRQYELMRVLLSTIPAYVYIKDVDSVYLLGNKHFSELNGVPENEISGKTDYDFFSKSDADRFRRDDAEILKTGNARLDYEVRGEDSEGNTIWYLTSKCPFYGPSGDTAGLVGICTDISSRKKAEADLKSLNEQLETRVEKRTAELAAKTARLEDANVALRVLLEQREVDRIEIQESFLHNIKNLLFPQLETLEQKVLSRDKIDAAIREIKRVLENIISARPRSLSKIGLSSTEIRIAEMIRTGKSTKEIADLLSVSDGTVRTYRDRIRKKLELINKKTNLHAYLNSLP